ncbi:ribonuclease [Sphingomonas sp. AX6]|uniref:ribonuclease n=1 Tax=Sphingomonas sp. AX6 TaxID=2653171 RepID=UPI0012F02D6E|nr:ribonuclease [Sphingomonas sp. AX6]VXC84370.1 Ribonuclease [Sphingomonas sp. AX6]
MSEWLYEAGIGENRAALIEGGEIVEAYIEPDDGGLSLGTVAEARLIERPGAARAARIAFADGSEALLDAIPTGLSEGRSLRVEIVREAIPEAGRPKAPRARIAAEGATIAPGPDLLARIAATGIAVRHGHPHQPDDLEAAGWSELLEEAASGEIGFSGGQLRMSVTPAMTLFDIDGTPPLEPLAIAGARAAAHAIRRFGIGGSTGVDFPTLPDKSARNRVVEAFDAAMPQPFERTAINGFGFLHVVRRRPRASLPEWLALAPDAAELRALLRRIEREGPTDPTDHRISLQLMAALDQRPDWLTTLHRRTGRPHLFRTV